MKLPAGGIITNESRFVKAHTALIAAYGANHPAATPYVERLEYYYQQKDNE